MEYSGPANRKDQKLNYRISSTSKIPYFGHVVIEEIVNKYMIISSQVAATRLTNDIWGCIGLFGSCDLEKEVRFMPTSTDERIPVIDIIYITAFNLYQGVWAADCV